MRELTAQDIIEDCEYMDLTKDYYLNFTGNKILIEEAKYESNTY